MKIETGLQMILKELKPRKALNKAFLKVKPIRADIEDFKKNLIQLLDRINDSESEEFHKNLVSDFLKKTYYDPHHFINTKGRNDLVIHNGNNAKSSVGVILEAKGPTNRGEMISTTKLNTKAFQELVLYYLRERITHKNLEVKHLVVTNIYEWFIFDAVIFDRLFAQNQNLVNQFIDFEAGRLADTKTDFFYRQIAEPFIESIISEIPFTYFNLTDYQKPLRNENKEDDNKLIALFKLMSPEHLLKLPFTNDSNSLDKRFYSELLHIIGLAEKKEGSKKLIGRNKSGERHTGSILEDAIIQLDSLDKISRLEKPTHFGNTRDEQLFNVALELSITWINRILFLKLLEAQLISYSKGDKSYSFLNTEKIKSFDDLNSLFFQVLARNPEDRNEDVKKIFEKVPYLNSSLFEPTMVEQATLLISNLRDNKTIPIISSTVLKDDHGKRLLGSMTTLEYLFAFLDAYDFSSEGAEDIQEDNKTLINASVLGLIFEKINGYKDGSFFTPGFITMYMCHQTIRKAVVQKFNEIKKWNCNNLEELYDKIDNRNEANDIINSIKICDPAVGSGHFLVSALNEMIAVKNDLKILQDREGKRLKEYHVEVVNDELIVTDEDGELFEYNPNNRESQRVQETLFHEKQTIIENCLFGVDINNNSVKICRLRLWIELLKNAYYIKREPPRPLAIPPFQGREQDITASYSPPLQGGVPVGGGGSYLRDGRSGSLQTLPNIDINIKCGNSLVSRFAIDADLKQALKKSKWTIDSYRLAVNTYRNAENKEQKRAMEKLIADIKSDFRSEIISNDPKNAKLSKLRGELTNLTQQQNLFELDKKEKGKWNKKVEKLTATIQKSEAEIEEIKANKIYENAFEWRFEFPEVLNEEGDFVGFDVVIGNPPYGRYLGLSDKIKEHLKSRNIYGQTGDIAESFIKLVVSSLLKNKFCFSFIIPKGLSYVSSWSDIRSLLLHKIFISQAIDTGRAFEEAAYEMMIFVASHIKEELIKAGKITEKNKDFLSLPRKLYESGIFFFGIPNKSFSIAEKIIDNSKPVGDFYDSWYGKGGMTPLINKNGHGIKVLTGKEIQRYFIKDINDKWFIDLEQLNDTDIERTHKKKVVAQDIVAHITRPKPHIKLTATMDYNQQFCLNTAMCFSERGLLSNEFLVGLINSSLMSFYFYYFIYNQAIRTMHFMPGYADRLPIPNNLIKVEEIEKLVRQIITAKSSNSQINTITLENQIDQLVYKLYDLTEEEIKIIENN